MIYIEEISDITVVICDRCGNTEQTTKPDGVVPEDWMTGHLWLDISMSQQKQTPLCFCPDCSDLMRNATFIQISGRVETQ